MHSVYHLHISCINSLTQDYIVAFTVKTRSHGFVVVIFVRTCERNVIFKKPRKCLLFLFKRPIATLTTFLLQLYYFLILFVYIILFIN